MDDKKDKKSIPLTGGMPAQQGTLPPPVPSRVVQEAHRQSRANQMGFDTQKTYYHGTNRPDIQSFDPNASTRTGSKGATFLTEDPKFANQYANSKAPGQVLPVHTNVKNTWDYDKPKDVKEVLSKLPKAVGNWALDQGLHKGNWNVIEDPRIQKAIKDSGYDSFHVEEGRRKNLGVFDPKNIRSKFAMFDTSKKDSALLSEAEGGEIPHYDEGGQVSLQADNSAPSVSLKADLAPSESTPPSNGIPIYDISGHEPVLGDMHPDDVHEAVTSGKYSLPKGSNVPVFNQAGELGDIPAEDAPSAFQNGYKYATPDAIEKHTYETPGQQAATIAEGLVSGVISRPVTSAIEQATGLTTGKDILARQKINPWEAGGSEAVGLIGGTLLGTGEGALLSHAGEAVAKVLGPKGASALAKIGARSLSDATQMVLYQSGNEVAKLIEGDPTQSVGSAATDIGLSGVLGAGVGAAFGAVSPLWKATVGEKAGQMIADFKGRMNFLKNNPDLNEALTKELIEHHAGVKSAADEVYGATGIKAQGLSEAMPEMSEKISGQAQEVADKMQARISKMAEDPYSYPPRLTTKLQTDLDNYLGKVTHPEAGSSEIFNAGQDLKQQLQGYSKFDKMLTAVDEGYDFVKDAKEMAHSLRTNLEDTDVWGKAGHLQQKINKAFTDYLPALKDFESKFGSKIGGEVQIDPGKVSTYINQLGKPNASVKQQMLNNFLDASEKYKKVISDVHGSLGSENPIQPSSLSVAHSTLDKVTPGHRLADYFVKEGVNHLSGHALGTSVGAAAGHLVGAPGIGAMIGERALGPMFQSVFQSIAKPVMEAAAHSPGFKSAIDYTVAVAKGEASMSKAAKSLFKAGGETASEALMPSETQRGKLDAQLKAIQQDPSKLTRMGGDIGHYMPQHAAALATSATAAATYLNNLRPKTDPSMPLDSKLPPDPVAQSRYNRALDIANNPLVLVKNIQKGTLTPQDVQDLHAINPGAYDRLSQKLTSEMMDHISKGETVPYRTRIQLSMFLGKPLDSTMTPEGIMGAQPKPQQPQPQTPQTPANRPKSSTAKLNNVSKQARTSSQSREERADK